MKAFSDTQLVWLVEDDADMAAATRQCLELEGFTVRHFKDARSALGLLNQAFPGIIVSDIRMPGMDGLELRAAIAKIDPDIPVILVTGHGDIAMAVQALKDGAFNFLSKPFDTAHLCASAQMAVKARALALDNRALQQAVVNRSAILAGESKAMQAVRSATTDLARTEMNVLVCGETGSGKSLAAQWLHGQSSRCGLPLLTWPIVDWAKRLPQLKGGTLLIESTELLSAHDQDHLMAILTREKDLDLRILACAGPGLEDAVKDGRLRADLYYRLDVVRLTMPPLRDRREDIPILFARFVRDATLTTGRRSYRMTPQVRRHLLQHDWPGNVRELQSFAFRAVLGLDEVPASTSQSVGPSDFAGQVARFETSLIEDALRAEEGNVTAACKRLSLPRKTMYEKLRRYGIDHKRFRTAAG